MLKQVRCTRTRGFTKSMLLSKELQSTSKNPGECCSLGTSWTLWALRWTGSGKKFSCDEHVKFLLILEGLGPYNRTQCPSPVTLQCEAQDLYGWSDAVSPHWRFRSSSRGTHSNAWRLCQRFHRKACKIVEASCSIYVPITKRCPRSSLWGKGTWAVDQSEQEASGQRRAMVQHVWAQATLGLALIGHLG